MVQQPSSPIGRSCCLECRADYLWRPGADIVGRPGSCPASRGRQTWCGTEALVRSGRKSRQCYGLGKADVRAKCGTFIPSRDAFHRRAIDDASSDASFPVSQLSRLGTGVPGAAGSAAPADRRSKRRYSAITFSPVAPDFERKISDTGEEQVFHSALSASVASITVTPAFSETQSIGGQPAHPGSEPLVPHWRRPRPKFAAVLLTAIANRLH